MTEEKMEPRTPTRRRQRKRKIRKKAHDEKDTIKMNDKRYVIDNIYNLCRSYKILKKWRREKGVKREDEMLRGKQNEFNKTSLITKVLKCLEIRLLLFKQSVRILYRISCKGNFVAHPPLRDNG